jgi:hypothetical protein
VYIAGTMDLNELPLEFDYDFLAEASTSPSYCTQPSFGVQGHSAMSRGKTIKARMMLMTH